MNKFYKILLTALVALAIVVPAVADGERVVTIGGNQPYRELTDFYMFSNVVGTGKIFYVDSGVSASGNGTSWATAKSTLDAAVALCTANNGDVILVAPGHAENLAAADAVDLDVAGITVIGLGEGQDKPEFTFTATAGEFVIGAASVTVTNVRFIPGISDVVMGISVEAAGDDFTLDSCEFMVPGTATFEFLDAIDLAALADRTTIKNCVYRDGTSSACNHFIEAGNGVNTGLSVIGNDIQGRFAVSAVWSNKADVGCILQDNVIANTISGQHCIEFTTTASGMIVGNKLYGDTEASILDPGSMYVEDNFISTAIDLDAMPRWGIDKAIDHLAAVADGTGNYPASVASESILSYIMSKSATAAATSYNNTTDSLEAISDAVAVAQADLDLIDTNTELQTLIFGSATGGSSTLTAVGTTIPALHTVPNADAATNTNMRDVVGNKTDAAVNAVAADKGLVGYIKSLVAGSNTGAGTTFWVQKNLTSSAVVQAGVDITGASSGGDLEIEQIILRTDGTGLATGTNFEIESDNALGLADILVETVANLGANKTITLLDAGITKKPTILTSTKKLLARSTVADCTGAGVINVSIKFRRLAAGATVAAAP